ncbi:MAG: tRNA pseudouridine(38-40) synthase TruA, partial [Lachnospiraceae bacterium]|nr:tRNA pseudouridine(38-40) synthase TruA [Lachnospiraceae bacterium]
EYRLTAGQAPSVFDRKYNHYCFRKPDKALMRKAADLLIGEHDLRAFSDNPRMKKSTVRNMSSIDIYEAGNEIQITFTGDDFWPNMVRLMTAAIVSVGIGETDVAALENAIKNGERRGLPEAIEPRGLFLSDVIYDE